MPWRPVDPRRRSPDCRLPRNPDVLFCEPKRQSYTAHPPFALARYPATLWRLCQTPTPRRLLFSMRSRCSSSNGSTVLHGVLRHVCPHCAQSGEMASWPDACLLEHLGAYNEKRNLGLLLLICVAAFGQHCDGPHGGGGHAALGGGHIPSRGPALARASAPARVSSLGQDSRSATENHLKVDRRGHPNVQRDDARIYEDPDHIGWYLG